MNRARTWRTSPPMTGAWTRGWGGGRVVRLGYLSGGLREHPDGKNLQGVFARHNRTRVEVYCFALKRDAGSEVQRTLQRTCQHYVDYTDADNHAVAAAINKLGVDVLLDVNGYTGEGVRRQRSVILAYTPAPVQVNFLVNFLAWVASSVSVYVCMHECMYAYIHMH